MSRKLYRWIDGKFVEIYSSDAEEQKSAFVHPDFPSDLNRPIRNMVTGELFTSKSKYEKDLKARGLDVVGTDLLSRKKHTPPEKINDAMIVDRIEKAESILNDPAKYRARQNENIERLERYRKLVHGNR